MMILHLSVNNACYKYESYYIHQLMPAINMNPEESNEWLYIIYELTPVSD